MSKKFKIGLLVFGLVAIIVALIIVQPTKSKDFSLASPYKIGIILPLSGELSSLGETTKNGALLAYNNLDNKNDLRLIFEDDQFDPKNTISAFNKLTEIERVNLVVCFASGPCSAVAPLAEEKKIPLIAIASNPKIQENKNYVVRLEIAPSQEAKTLLTYLQGKNYQSIASVVAQQDGIKAGYGELKKDANFNGREVAMENVAPDLKDFHTTLTKLLTAKPDLIFIGLLPGSAGDFGKQAKEMAYTGDFIGFNFIEGEETLTAAKGSLNGLIYTNAQESQSWFSDLYLKTYQKAKGPGAAHIYDAINLINIGLTNKQFTREQMANYLNTINNYSGALGTFSSTQTHEYTLPVALKKIINNQFTTY